MGSGLAAQPAVVTTIAMVAHAHILDHAVGQPSIRNIIRREATRACNDHLDPLFRNAPCWPATEHRLSEHSDSRIHPIYTRPCYAVVPTAGTAPARSLAGPRRAELRPLRRPD